MHWVWWRQRLNMRRTYLEPQLFCQPPALTWYQRKHPLPSPPLFQVLRVGQLLACGDLPGAEADALSAVEAAEREAGPMGAVTAEAGMALVAVRRRRPRYWRIDA